MLLYLILLTLLPPALPFTKIVGRNLSIKAPGGYDIFYDMYKPEVEKDTGESVLCECFFFFFFTFFFTFFRFFILNVVLIFSGK